MTDSPKKAPSVLLIAGAGCLFAIMLAGVALLATCGACMNALEPGEIVYHAHAGECRLDVLYLDANGKEVRRPRVRGMPDGVSKRSGPWTKDVDLEPGDRYKISVIPAESCTRATECWVTYRGTVITPKTKAQAHPDCGNSALCEGTVPGR